VHALLSVTAALGLGDQPHDAGLVVVAIDDDAGVEDVVGGNLRGGAAAADEESHTGAENHPDGRAKCLGHRFLLFAKVPQ
jgi:hypothetical protein